MSEWEVGEASPAERVVLLRREKELFGEDSALRAEWLLDQNPAGRALVLVARTPHGRIAGTRSLLPWRVLVSGKEVRVGQYTRTWTDPEFRHQGVSIAIGRELNRRSVEIGYPIVFLFPSDRSIPGHRRVGNQLESALARRQMLLSLKFLWGNAPGVLDGCVGWFRRRRARSLRAGGVWSPAEAPARLADALWEAEPKTTGVLGVRDASFVGWRYSAESGRDYVGMRYPSTGAPRLLAILHHTPDRARLLDLWGTAGADEKAAALAALVEGLVDRGSFLVEWCPPRFTEDTRIADRVGFVRRRRGVPMGLWFNLPPKELGILADPKSFRLTEGDSDYA
jgi:GNAT acetyltransferase-like protein